MSDTPILNDLNFKATYNLSYPKARFILIIVGIIIGTGSVLAAIINTGIQYSNTVISADFTNPHNLWFTFNFAMGLWISLTTFTIVSNIFLIIYYVMAIINYFWPHKLTIVHGNLKIACTTYIIVTMLIYFAVLFGISIDKVKEGTFLMILEFINTFFLHLICPGIMITYFFYTRRTKIIPYKTLLKRDLWIIVSVLLLYMTGALIKGTFVGDYDSDAHKIIYSYPYGFLNIKEHAPLFAIMLAVICVLTFSLIAIYSYLNNNKIVFRFKKNKKDIIKNKSE